MKRIYLFVLTALMMLMSTSAMAQSETVKGDVNGDGVVDVADIAAVIKIMTENGSIEKKYYWYVGQDSADTFITTDNYKQYCQNVTNYQSTQTFTVNDKYLYLVVLADKTIEAIDSSGGPLNFKYLRGNDNVYIPVANDATLITLDDGKIYRIYRSASTANDKYTITIK
ncbi:MAG: hypothetical protein IJ421_03245 [Prevotella sp.]|nr:hypothetical protein [Prevotella sp.]